MLTPLPPLNPLYTFAVAARTGGFTNAAQELGVSQAAVSRQVAVLEEALGIRLFERHGRRVRLSVPGRAYHRRIAPAFEEIERATRRLVAQKDPMRVRVQVYPTFAARWLLPRLPGFNILHPECDVRLQTAVAPADFINDDIDVAIQLGDGAWPGCRSAPVVPDVIEPVCGPRLIERIGPLETARDLAAAPVLQTRYRRRDWADWLAFMNWPAPAVTPDQVFESSLLAYQAAIEGIGVAMGQVHLLADALAAGTLVRPFERPLTRPLGHYVVWPADRAPARGVRHFVDWLIAEAEIVRARD